MSAIGHIFIEDGETGNMLELAVQKMGESWAYPKLSGKYYVAVFGKTKYVQPYDEHYFDTIAEADAHFAELIEQNGWDCAIDAAV